MTQVSPVCQTAGRFVVAGRKGLNRVRFAGRVGGKQLAAGTYKISARAGGRVVKRVTIVVFDGSAAPTKAALASARASNTCSAFRGPASTSRKSTGASNTGLISQLVPGQRSALSDESSAIGATKGSNTHSGVLASTVEKTARAIRPVLVILLAAAILLLGLASLPRAAVAEPRVNDLLARHRLEIAGAGAVAFAAVIIAFLLGT